MTSDDTNTQFEMIDKTALEFAIALIASGDKQKIQSLSKESIKLAKAWHDKTEFRKSFLLSKSLTENDWIKINSDSDYDTDDLEIGREYWVIREQQYQEDAIHPEKAIFVKIDTRKERQQPFFQLEINPYNPFPIVAYLPLHIGSQLLNETPSHPTKTKIRDTPTSSSLSMSY